jgi:sodium pump decarboxylase gamma subunit
MMIRLLDSLILTVVGFGVVFLVLAVAAGLTALLKNLNSQPNQKNIDGSAHLKENMLIEENEITESEVEEQIDPEVVTAIVAAIHYHLSRMRRPDYGVVRRTDVRRG